MKQIASAVVGGGIVGALWIAMSRSPATPPPAPLQQGLISVDAEAFASLQRQVEQLTRRVLDLETLPQRVIERTAAPKIPERADVLGSEEDRPPTATQSLDDVDRLRKDLSHLSWEPLPDNDAADETRVVEQMIYTLQHDSGAARLLGALTSIQLCQRFLEKWPTDERAEAVLRQLVDASKRTLQYHKAMEAIEHFSSRILIAVHDADSLRLTVARSDVDRIEIASRLAASAPDRHMRAWALEALAHSLMRTGRHSDALAAVDELLLEFADLDGYVNVDRARELRDGILLLDRDRSARIGFEVDARNRYSDMQPMLRAYPRQRS